MTDNKGIVIMEKPDCITYRDISNVLQKAHEQLRNSGIFMRVPHLPPEELEKWVGDEGKCFVAMDGDKLAATSSVIFRELNRWYYKGKAAEVTMQGVLPEYQGKHIFSMLNKACEEAARESGYPAVFFDTAEANTQRIKIGEKDGYLLVDYFGHRDHCSVGMMKWFDGCPFPGICCTLLFRLKKLYVKMRHLVRS